MKKHFKYLFAAFDSRDSYDAAYETFVKADNEAEGRTKFARRLAKKGYDPDQFAGLLVLDTIPNS